MFICTRFKCSRSRRGFKTNWFVQTASRTFRTFRYVACLFNAFQCNRMSTQTPRDSVGKLAYTFITFPCDFGKRMRSWHGSNKLGSNVKLPNQVHILYNERRRASCIGARWGEARIQPASCSTFGVLESCWSVHHFVLHSYWLVWEQQSHCIDGHSKFRTASFSQATFGRRWAALERRNCQRYWTVVKGSKFHKSIPVKGWWSDSYFISERIRRCFKNDADSRTMASRVDSAAGGLLQ